MLHTKQIFFFSIKFKYSDACKLNIMAYEKEKEKKKKKINKKKTTNTTEGSLQLLHEILF